MFKGDNVAVPKRFKFKKKKKLFTKTYGYKTTFKDPYYLNLLKYRLVK